MRRSLSVGLFSTIARKSPSANARNTESAAYANVQRKTRTNGSRYSGFVRTVEKFSKPTCVRQPGSITSPDADSYEPSPLSVNTVPVSMFVNVSASASYTSVGCSSTAMLRALGADEAVLARGDDERGELRVDAGELRALQHLVALGRGDRADLDGRALRRKRLEPALRSDVEIAADVVDEEEDELAVLRRRRRRVRLPVGRGDERHLLDRDDRLVLREVVPRRPVRERDVRVRDDRDDDERDEEDDARSEVLERNDLLLG